MASIFARTREQRGLSQDVIALQQFIQNRQRSLSDPNIASPSFPTATSAEGGQLFGKFLLNRQQQIGQQRLQATKPITPKQTSSVIRDPQDPNKAIRVRNTFDAQGNLINQQFIGEATLPEEVGGVAPEIFTQLQKPVATQIQKELKEVNINIENLESILDQFKPEFTEIPFKIQQRITVAREKVGGLLGRPTAEQKAELAAFSAWKRDASREFVVFKKWATGVAAGQKEMTEQIQEAFASPRTDSATQFESKIRSALRVRRRTRVLLTNILNSGTVLTIRDKKQAEQDALQQALKEIVRPTQKGQQQIQGQQTLQPLTQVEEARRQELLRKVGQ